jgi:ubiquinone/menaquinone biosynthesis C-methylase UbiE
MTPAPPQHRVARLFDAVADTYDEVGVDFFGPIAQVLLELLAPQPGETVVDLGCGKGALLLGAARAVGSTGRTLGIDIAPAMVAAARQRADAHGLAHVDLKIGDVCAPDLPDATFDVAASSLVLFFLPDPLAALTTWRRALVPAGRLGVSTFGPQDDVWRAVDDLFAAFMPPQMLDARASGSRGPFASDAGVEALLQDAGLVDVRTHVHDLSVRFADVEQWYSFSRSTGQRALWDAMPPAERTRVRQEAGRLLRAGSDADGALVVRQQVRYTLGSNPS